MMRGSMDDIGDEEVRLSERLLNNSGPPSHSL